MLGSSSARGIQSRVSAEVLHLCQGTCCSHVREKEQDSITLPPVHHVRISSFEANLCNCDTSNLHVCVFAYTYIPKYSRICQKYPHQQPWSKHQIGNNISVVIRKLHKFLPCETYLLPALITTPRSIGQTLSSLNHHSRVARTHPCPTTIVKLM